MSGLNQNKHFEDWYWSENDQKTEFRHRAAIELIDDGPVIDIGCGDGLLLKKLREQGIDGVGIELSSVASKKAKDKGLEIKNLDFLHEELPFPSSHFKYAIALDVLEHLLEPQTLLAKMRDVSSTGIIIGVPNFSSLPARLQMLFGKVPENNVPRKGHMFWFNYKTLISMINKNGFAVEKVKVNSPLQRIPILGKFIFWLAKLRPSLFALSFVIKARKV